MNRFLNRYKVFLVVLLFLFVISFNTVNNQSRNSVFINEKPVNQQSVPAYTANYENFVDAILDYHFPTDIGTHSDFTIMQVHDEESFDTLTEESIVSDEIEDTVDSDTSNVGDPTDYGTLTNFANMQDLGDSDYATITEGAFYYTSYTLGNTGSSSSSYVSFASNSIWGGTFTSSSAGAVYNAYAYCWGTSATVNIKAVVVTSSTLTIVANGISAAVSCTTTPQWHTFTFSGQPVLSASTAYVFMIIADGLARFGRTSLTDGITRYDLANSYATPEDPIGAGTYAYQMCIYAIVQEFTHLVDQEIQWTSATYSENSEELVIKTGTRTGSENLLVDVWSGSWNLIGILSWSTTNTYNVHTWLTSSTFTIRFRDADTSDLDIPSDSWNIDAAYLHVWNNDYRLDLEVGWSTAESESNRYLCICAETQNAEALGVDVWNTYTNEWVNVIADLVGSSGTGAEPGIWNNVSITSYTYGANVYIRFVDSIQTSDASQSSWDIGAVLLHCWTVNSAPAIWEAPSSTDLDDGDNMYARYKDYSILVYCYDPNGYTDIVTVDLYLYNDARSVNYWIMRYTEDNNTFSEYSDTNNLVTLNTSTSSASRSVADIHATFELKINWAQVSLTDIDLRVIVTDVDSATADIYYEVNWDIISKLDYSVNPYVTADDAGTANRGDFDETFYIGGTIIYNNSGDNYPPFDELDVWISASEYGNNVGPWSNTSLLSDTFLVTCYADNAMGNDTYTVKVVKNGEGSGGTDLYYTTSKTTTYVADSYIISFTVTDSRINIGENASVSYSVISAYDSAVYDGTVNLNYTTWTQTTVQKRFFTVSSLGGDDTYGVTTILTNDVDCVIWDRIQVQFYTVADNWVNNGTNVNIYFLMYYDYDNMPVTTGDFTLNGYDATHMGTGTWRIIRTSSSPAMVNYSAIVVTAVNTYNISVVDLNGKWKQVVWDSVTITLTDPIDQRQNVGANATGIYITITMNYNSTPYGGVAYMNNTDYNGDGINVGKWGYTVSSVNGGTKGITIIAANDETYMIWDKIYVVSLSYGGDTRVDIGTTINFDWTLKYGYDEVYVSTGTHTINGYALVYQGVGVWRYTNSSALVGDLTLNSITLGGDDTYGITTMFMNSQSVTEIWDRIIILTTITQDGRIDTNTQADIRVTAELEYDHHTLGSGDILYMNGTSMSWASSYFRLQPQFNAVDIWNFFVNSTSANEATYGITAVYLNGNNVNQIWDRIYVVSMTYTGTPDNRVTIGTMINFDWILHYDYNEEDVSTGTHTINGYSLSYQGSGVWRYTNSSALVGDLLLDSIALGGDDTYAITVMYMNGQSITMIWDQIKVMGYTSNSSDNHDNIGTYVNISVWLHYDYDEANVTTGTITINGQSYIFDGISNWTAVFMNATHSTAIWNSVVAVGDDTQQISSVNQNSKSITYVWDSLTISFIGPTDNRQNIGSNATGIVVSAVYDEGGSYDGTFTLNDTDYDGDGISIAIAYFTVQSADGNDAYGIISISTNDNTYMIWDRIIWQSYQVNSTINYGANGYRNDTGIYFNVTMLIQFEYDNADVTNGIITLNGESCIHIAGGYWYINVINSTASFGQDYTFNVIISSGNNFGITTINNNSQELILIWDCIEVYDDGCDYYDVYGKVNVGQNISIWASVWLVYDHHNLTSGDYIEFGGEQMTWNGSYFTASYTRYEVGLWVFTINNTLSYEDTYKITAGTNTPVNIIFDRILIYDMWLSDYLFNQYDTIDIYVSLVSEYDNESMQTGLVQINGTLGIESIGDINSTFVSLSNWINSTYIPELGTYKWLLTWANWTTYNLTVINYNGWNITYLTGSTDRVVVISYATNSTDGRDNINTLLIIIVWLQYQTDSANVTDGTVIINGDVFTHLIDGNWTASFSNSTASYAKWDTVVVSGNDREISVVDQNGQFYEYIWDSYTVVITIGDNRINVGDNATIGFTVLSDCDELVYNGITILNSTTYDYGTIGIHYYTLTPIEGDDTYGITAMTNDIEYVIWDQIKVLGYVSNSSDSRDNIGTYVNVSVWLQYGYDDANVTDGYVWINGQTLSYLTGWNWTALFMNNTVSDAMWNSVTCLNNLYNITNINQNGKSYSYIWDRIIVMSYGTNSTDDRDNIGTYVNVTVLIYYDYDNTDLINGTVVINGDSYTYLSGGYWYSVFMNNTVSDATWDTVVVAGNTPFDITNIYQNGQSYYYVWDQIIVRGYVTNSTDNRDNIGTYVNVSIWIQYNYDDTNVTDGFVTINGQSLLYLAGWKWAALFMNNTVSDSLWNLVACTGNYWDITSVNQNGKSQNYIWDQIIVLAYYTNSTDDRDNIGTYVAVAFSLQYDYDNTDLINGTVIINGDTFIHTTGSFWNATFMNSTASDAEWNTTIVAGNTPFDITDVNQNGINYKYIWDRVIITVAVNMTWTIVTYYVNVSYTGIYEYDSSVWMEYSTIANTTLTITNLTHYEELTKVVVENYTFYVIDFTDTSFSLTEFTTTTVWCIWDNITVNYVDYYTTVELHNKKLFILFDYLYWQYNGSGIGANWVCYNIRNGTAGSLAVTVLSSFLNPNWQEVTIPVNWTYVEYTNNATKTINGRAYNFQWYTLEVEIIAQMFLRNLIPEVLEDVVSVSGTINTNAAYQVYNEIDGIFVLANTGTVSVVSEGIEEGFQITFDIIYTYGQHNFAINFTALTGAVSQWFNQSYVINFNIDIEIPEEKGDYMEIKGISNFDCEWYVYNSDSSNWTGEDGTIEGGNNYFLFWFYMETTIGLHNYSLYFNISSTVYVWKNSSYYVGNTYGSVTVTLYDGQSNVFVDNNYKMYINGTRSPSLTFYNRTDYVYLLTFTDYFGYMVYSAIHTFPVDGFIDIQLSVYTFKVYSEMSSEFIYFNLTRSGGAKFSQHLGPSEILTYRLVSGDYTYDFKKVHGIDFDYYTGSFTLTGDTSYIISDISLEEIWQAVLRDVGGKTNIKPLMAAMYGMADSLALIQWTLLILSAVIIGLMIFRGYTTEETIVGKDGTVKKKRKLPKVLEKYKFSKGSKNPRFGGIPKGAGQDAWTKAGVTFKKDESDK